MSDKLGFTFYPKDWWTSDTFFELDHFERYIYLECLFIMYLNEGYLKTQKTQLENRTRTQISDEVWQRVTKKFISDEIGLTHPSVNKRLRKVLANRENGKKGGRPEKPKKPNSETQNNPPSEIEKKENRIEDKIGLYISKFNAIRKSKFKGVDKPFMQNFKKLLESDYTANDSLVALKNAMQDKFHIDNNFKYLTPEFITRLDKIELFLNSGKPTETKEQEIERREREWLNR
jgi:hypothetical protein